MYVLELQNWLKEVKFNPFPFFLFLAATPSPTAQLPGCHSARVDIAFVLDDSASVGERKFNLLRSFVGDVASQFFEFGPNGLQMAAVTYNGEPT